MMWRVGVAVVLGATLGGHFLHGTIEPFAEGQGAGVMNALERFALGLGRIDTLQIIDQPRGDQLVYARTQTGRTLGMLRAHVVQQTVVVCDETCIQTYSFQNQPDRTASPV